MRSPVSGNGALEDRSKLRVGTNLDIEAIHETMDSVLGYRVGVGDR
jgi:hypothetical protein